MADKRAHASQSSSSASRPTSWPISGRCRRCAELPLDVRETIAEVLGGEAATHGLDEDENPNAYGRELGELFDALGL